MNNEFDIAVIGGGPAGATAATFLARADFNVCLFEKKEFPRETLCGEFLSNEVVQILKELKLFERFLRLKPNEIKFFRMISPSGKEIFAPLGFTAYGMKRGKFDDLILQSAKESGVKIFQPCEVKNVLRGETKFVIKVKSSEKEFIVKVKKVIAAYGKQNVLDKNLRNFSPENSGLNGIKFHFDVHRIDNFSKNEIQIYLGKGIYCGVNSVDENKITICFLEDKNKISASNSRESLSKLASENKKFDDIFVLSAKEESENSKIYGTGNIYFGKKDLVKNGVFMIGDAARVIAPLAGDGIGMAMQSAKLLSFILINQKRKNYSDKKVYSLYKRKWKKLFRRRLFFAKLVQKILLNGKIKKMAFDLGSLFPGVVKRMIKLTRGSEKFFFKNF